LTQIRYYYITRDKADNFYMSLMFSLFKFEQHEKNYNGRA